MNDDDKPAVRPPENTVAHRLTGLFTGIGLALAVAALAGVGFVGPHGGLLVLFWCGWAVLTVALLAGLFTLRSPLPIDNPLKVIRFGLATVILGIAMEVLSGAPMKPLWGFGALTMLLGIGWALWNIGELRK